MAHFTGFMDKYYLDFFPTILFSDFYITLTTKDVNKFHEFMTIFMNEDIIQQCMQKHNIQMDLVELKNLIKKNIAYNILNNVTTSSKLLIDILINEYDFIPTTDLLQNNMHALSDELVLFFQNYIEPDKYINLMRERFNALCWGGRLAALKQIVNSGFDIQDLIKIPANEEFDITIVAAAIQNNDPNVLKYLLENGVDYKRYEMKMIKTCIKERRLKALKTLIEHGINISIIDNININAKFDKNDIDMCQLLIDNVNPLVAMLLMTRFDD